MEVLKTTKETLEVIEKRLALLVGKKSVGEGGGGGSEIRLLPPDAPSSPSQVEAAIAGNATVAANQGINATAMSSDPVKTSIPSITEEGHAKKKSSRKGGAAPQ